MKKTLLFTIVLCICLVPAKAEAWTSPIAQRYNTDSALRAVLGDPLSPEYGVAGGSMRTYENGTLYYKSTTGVHEVHGAIREKFREEGGLQVLGFPTTDEHDVYGKSTVIGQESTFQNGVVVSSAAEGVHWMGNVIAATWHENIYPYLYMPTSDQLPDGTTRIVYFYEASIRKFADNTTEITYPSWVQF